MMPRDVIMTLLSTVLPLLALMLAFEEAFAEAVVVRMEDGVPKHLCPRILDNLEVRDDLCNARVLNHGGAHLQVD